MATHVHKMRVLGLTSPRLMRDGQDRLHPHDVSAVQRLLHRHLILGHPCYSGAIDGICGPHTAQAFARAKHSYGYPARGCRPTCGDGLRSYLSGDRRMDAAHRARAAAWLALERRRASRHASIAAGLHAEALRHVGYHEPGDGSSVFGKWYGLPGPNTPWCAMFATYCAVEGGHSRAFARGSRWSYCPAIYDAAVHMRDGLRLTGRPIVGDLALFSWDRDRVADHVGIVHRVPTAAEVFTVDGNRSDQVEIATTARGLVLAFVHVTT